MQRETARNLLLDLEIGKKTYINGKCVKRFEEDRFEVGTENEFTHDINYATELVVDSDPSLFDLESDFHLIYVAGPFRGTVQLMIEQDCKIADKACVDIFNAGHVPIRPHQFGRLYVHINEDTKIHAMYKLLARCDGILVLSNWQAFGTMFGDTMVEEALWEEKIARNLGIPCCGDLDALLKKISDNKKYKTSGDNLNDKDDTTG